MKKKIVFLGILLVILGIMGIGCYTILTHPRVQGEEAENVEQTGQYYREHCTDCHSDYHQYPYGFYYGYYPDYYWSSPRWGHYYAYPWWWDNYWWNETTPSDNGGAQTPQGVEKAERRRGLEPPYVRPEANPSIPYVPPAATKEGESTQTGIENKPKAQAIDKQDQPKQEQSDKEKAERRRK
ncbi:MAG: hypothetical protein WCE90_02525 [Candidatus Zixiibacteriota bacterium]